MESSWNEEEVWRVEMYVSFGIMSFGLMSLLAVTSIPSISSTLNWREFSFIQVNAKKTCSCTLCRICCHMVAHNLNHNFDPPNS